MLVGGATSNALEGKPLTEGLAQAALLGRAGGAAGALGGKLLSGGAKALSKALGKAEKEAVAAAEGEGNTVLEGAACAINSFDPNTPVATPDGAKAIGDIQVGDTVTAYDPNTGHAKAEPVEHVFINHDTNLLDVTLAPLAKTATIAAQDAAVSPKEARAAIASHGTRAPPTSQTETLHTTTEHPFLTTDRGFVDAVKLRVGEQVQQLDGRVGVVVAVVVTPGAAVRYNLTVRELHTFAVGAGLWVVHNAGPCGPGEFEQKVRDLLGDPHTDDAAHVRVVNGNPNDIARPDAIIHEGTANEVWIDTKANPAGATWADVFHNPNRIRQLERYTRAVRGGQPVELWFMNVPAQEVLDNLEQRGIGWNLLTPLR